MILLVRTHDQQEIIIDVDTIKSIGLLGSARTRIMPVHKTGEELGDIDLNECRVELLPDDSDKD